VDAQFFFNQLPVNWSEKLAPIKNEPFFSELIQFLDAEYKKGKTIYPARTNIFRALEQVDLPDVKVVIFGQDPYHGPDQAIGLSFAVPNSLRLKPPSLQNIFKELQSDFNITIPKTSSDLSGWVKQGVLLLNRVLTVEAALPLSHRDRGWEQFTDRIVSILNERKEPIVFILWGSHAQKLKERIDLKKHAVIETPHPSPLSAHRGFFGSKVFSRANELLHQFNQEPIRWDRVTQ
jgi:uracil-DNA glycosylase